MSLDGITAARLHPAWQAGISKPAQGFPTLTLADLISFVSKPDSPVPGSASAGLPWAEDAPCCGPALHPPRKCSQPCLIDASPPTLPLTLPNLAWALPSLLMNSWCLQYNLASALLIKTLFCFVLHYFVPKGHLHEQQRPLLVIQVNFLKRSSNIKCWFCLLSSLLVSKCNRHFSKHKPRFIYVLWGKKIYSECWAAMVNIHSKGK